MGGYQLTKHDDSFFKSSDIELEKEQNLEFVGYVEWISQTMADDVKVKLPLIWGFSRNKIRTTDSQIHKRKKEIISILTQEHFP